MTHIPVSDNILYDAPGPEASTAELLSAVAEMRALPPTRGRQLEIEWLVAELARRGIAMPSPELQSAD